MIIFRKIAPVFLLVTIALTGCTSSVPLDNEPATPSDTSIPQPAEILEFKNLPTFITEETETYLTSQDWLIHEDELDAGLVIYSTNSACSLASNILPFGIPEGLYKYASFGFLSEQAILSYADENQIDERIKVVPLNVGTLGMLDSKVLKYESNFYETSPTPEEGEGLAQEEDPPATLSGSRSGFVLSYIFPQPLQTPSNGGETHPALLVRYECADTDADPLFWEGFIETLRLDVSHSL